MGEFVDYAIQCDRRARYAPIPKGTKCKECGKAVTRSNSIAINTKPEYVHKECWDKAGYEYDQTPW